MFRKVGKVVNCNAERIGIDVWRLTTAYLQKYDEKECFARIFCDRRSVVANIGVEISAESVDWVHGQKKGGRTEYRYIGIFLPFNISGCSAAEADCVTDEVIYKASCCGNDDCEAPRGAASFSTHRVLSRQTSKHACFAKRMR